MKFLADENVEKPIVNLLRNLGHDVKYMTELTKRTVDEQLLDIAQKEFRILITNDKDFGELVFLQKKLSSGILLMRFNTENSQTKVK